MVSKVTVRAELIDEVSTGLRNIDRGFRQTFERVGQLSQRALSFAGRFTGIAAGLSAALVSREALTLAERQVQAERRLLEALNGRATALERIRDLASDLQRRTTFGDEEILDVASGLLAAGVAADQLDRALEATLSTSVALGVSTDQVAQAIASFQINQTGLLARRAPFLKELAEDGRLAAEGIDALIDRFGGAAEALADTPFGEAQQQANRYGDALERLGNVLIRIKVAAFDPVVGAVERLAEALEAPSARVLVRTLETAAPVLSGLAIAAGAFLTALVGLGAAISAFQVLNIGAAFAAIGSALAFVVPLLVDAAAIVALLYGGFGTLRIALQAIVTAFPSLGRVIDRVVVPVQGLLETIIGQVREVFSLLGDGRATIVDLFDLAADRLRAFSLLIADLLAVPGQAVEQTFGSLRRAFDAEADRLSRETLRRQGLTEEQITARLGLPPVADVEGQLQTLGDAFVAAFERYADRLEQSNANFRQRVAANTQELTDIALRAATDAETAAEQAFQRIGELSNRTQGILELDPQGIQAIPIDDLIDTDRLAALLDSVGEESRDQLRELLMRRLQREVDQERITLVEFFRARRLLEIDVSFRDESSVLDQLSQVETQAAAIRERLQEAVVAGLSVQDQLDQATDPAERAELAQRLQAALEDEADATESLLGLERQRLELADQVLQARLAQAAALEDMGEREKATLEDLFQTAVEAREQLDQRLQAIASQADAGLLFPAEAREQQREAIEEFQALLDGLRLQLVQIAAEAPELSGIVADLLRMLSQIPRALPTEGQTFFQGLREGARTTVVELGNLGRAGVNFGQTLIGGLSQAFSSFFLDTREGFRQTVANVLRGLAQILLQVALLRALGFVFPSPANVPQGTQAILQTGAGFGNLGGLVASGGAFAFNVGGIVRGLGRRVAPLAAALALVAAPAAARTQALTEAQEAQVQRIAEVGGAQFPLVKPDGTEETAKEMVRRLGRERTERERLARELAQARGHGEDEFRALAESMAGQATSARAAELVREIAAEVARLEPSALAKAQTSPAVRFAASAARGASQVYEVIGRTGVKALVVMGAMGLLGDDVQVAEPHAIGGFAGVGVPKMVDTSSGFVPGSRGPNRDSVLSYLTIGEAVIQRPSVDYYGERLLAAINARLIPRELLWPLLEGLPASLGRATHAYNDGGVAGGPSTGRQQPGRRSGSSGSSASVLPVLPADDSTLERLLAGGRRAFVRHIASDRGEIRTALGIDSTTR